MLIPQHVIIMPTAETSMKQNQEIIQRRLRLLSLNDSLGWSRHARTAVHHGGAVHLKALVGDLVRPHHLVAQAINTDN